ncbi:MAG: site-specific integrase [Methanobrevibacter sp.]|jgi:integrase|nr:site-specific integrase [Candidatus Methanoflexus mossambicus]
MIFNENDREILKRIYDCNQFTIATQKKYESVLKSYSGFVGLNLGELIKEAKKEQISYINSKNQIIEVDIEETKLAHYLRSYIFEEKNRKIASSTLINKQSTIRAFYNHCGLKQLPKPIKIINIQKELNILDYEDIKIAINSGDIKQKAIFSFMASTGIRSVDVRNFRIKDILNAFKIEDIDEIYDIGDYIGYWEFNPIKTKRNNTMCKVCSSNESSEYLIKYLIKRLENEKINDDNYLFSNNNGNQISQQGFIYIFSKMNKIIYKNRLDDLEYKLNKNYLSKNKFKMFKEKIPKFHPHGLRKFFITTINSYCNNIKIINLMSGHKHSNKIDTNYINFDEKIIRENYYKFLDKISFNTIK